MFGKAAAGGMKAIGKGQCPLCHTFDPGDNIGRCPNLFGVEERSHTRIKEDRYLNEPVKVGELEPGHCAVAATSWCTRRGEWKSWNRKMRRE